MTTKPILTMLLAAVAATSCSSTATKTASDTRRPAVLESPASVAGQKIELDFRYAKHREGYDGQPIQWEAWQHITDKTVETSGVFGANNECDTKRFPGDDEGAKWIYKKTGEATAELTLEGWESITTYKLDFCTQTLGAAESSGEGEGMFWQTKDITFKLIQP